MIIKGILENIASGVRNLLFATDRAYFTVNGIRYTHSSTSTIIDNIMEENLGKEISLSIRKTILFGKVICAISEPNKCITKINGGLIFWMFLMRLICYGIPTGIICIINSFMDSPLYGLLLLIFPIISMIKDILASNKLN